MRKLVVLKFGEVTTGEEVELGEGIIPGGGGRVCETAASPWRINATDEGKLNKFDPVEEKARDASVLGSLLISLVCRKHLKKLKI